VGKLDSTALEKRTGADETSAPDVAQIKTLANRLGQVNGLLYTGLLKNQQLMVLFFLWQSPL
jgi:hypothetical protein